jgi:hypothetical protein
MKPGGFIVVMLVWLGLASCSSFVTKQPEPEQTTTPEIFMPLPSDTRAFEAVRALLAKQLGVDPLTIAPVDVTPVDWPDSCLGLAASGEVCSQVVTPGFIVRVRDGDAIYEFHTDHEARQIRQVR